MDTSAAKILLALLLALTEIEPTLISLDDQSRLANLGQQLALPERDWEFAQQCLMHLLDANPVFKPLYEEVKSQLDSLDEKSLLNFCDLLPTPKQLQKVLSPSDYLVPRGYKPSGNSDETKSLEIPNQSLPILTGILDKPQQAEKILPFNKMKTFLQTFGRANNQSRKSE
ncbi:hypothetical protein [Kamptonema formosum]|uniref:hypothetical protein n=1 Tax=Kamptonema formosum TaxID=331992 RepID=UPI00034950B0|nr:hypothetical protein [Oscillatoria sp. PCC 10802]